MAIRERKTATIHRFTRPGPIGVVLRVTSRLATPPEFRLLSGSCVVGAGSGVDLVIDDETVSRRHVELTLVPEGVAIQDLGSHNGTYYLGQRVRSAVLAIGSKVFVGGAEIRIEPDRESLASSNPEEITSYGDMQGVSPAMRKLFNILLRLESSLVNVLVQGESGTGKELVAHAIHHHSPASAGPFLAVNCGAIDRAFVRSELFGHKRGAFTGAVEPRTGAFEAASGGTLFLDEIGELPIDVQPVLLRALEVGAITRMGENNERPVKVRIVAATNRDLAAEVQAGHFREDLYFRLVVVHLKVPPLRERPDDVEALARHFALQFGLPDLGDDVLAKLSSRSWPGNVRELKNAVQTYGVLGTLPDAGSAHDAALDDALRAAIDLEQPYAAQKDDVLKRFLRVYLEALLTHTNGNQSKAAQISGLQRSYLNRVLGQLKAGRANVVANDES